MRVLITGGSGMVGRNLLEHPGARRHEVLAPARKELDLFDPAATRAYLAQRRPDLVIHCAGRVGGIQANMAAPVEFLVQNWDVGRNVLLAAREAGVPRLVNMGSSCMYPRDWPTQMDESLVLGGPLEPTNEGYAIAKVAVARLASYIRRENPAFQYKTVIACNLYGRYDHFDPKSSHLVAAALNKVHQAKLARAPEVEVWGDGTARREFMYSGDLADFLWTALERFDALPELVNVGPGVDHTVNEYYETAMQAVGYPARLKHLTDKAVGMQRKLMAVDKARQFGWQPPTDLLRGMRATYEYYLATHG